MAGVTTRKSIREFKDSLNDDNLCIIPADVFKSLIETNANQQDVLIQTQNKLCVALERIAENVALTDERRDTQFKLLLEKMDSLTSALSVKNTTMQSHATTNPPPAALKEFVTKQKDILWKSLRSKELAAYYKELLERENPFAPHKFRTKINESTPEYEKVIHNQQTVNTVQNEIKLMEERVRQWGKQLNELQADFESNIRLLSNEKREELKKQIRNNSEEVTKNWHSAFTKIKKSYDDEMTKSNATQFLLKYADQSDNATTKDNNSNQYRSNISKNWRGPNQGGRYRKPFRRFQQN